MGNSNQINKDNTDYYQNLLNTSSKTQAPIFEAIADKLIWTLDVNVLDFSKSAKKEVLINQVRSKQNLLYLRKPIKLKIEKFEGGFSIFQEDLSVLVYAQTFRRTLKKFQETFYHLYHKYSCADFITPRDIILKKLFCALVKRNY